MLLHQNPNKQKVNKVDIKAAGHVEIFLLSKDTGKRGKGTLFAHDGQAKLLLGGSLHIYYPSSLAFFGGRFGLG